MTNLPPSTLRRLQRLKRTNAIWEGDARPLPTASPESTSNTNVVSIHRGAADNSIDQDAPHCVMWVDTMTGMVRTMEVMEHGQSHEILVRSLLKSIERPQPPAEPGLPKKILVRDRQLQFYLRGALQGLDITVEYGEHLPLLDEVYSYFMTTLAGSPPSVPKEYEDILLKESKRFYGMAPWKHLWDHQVITVELNRWDVDTLYAIVMGRLGMECGVIFYRSEESLISFRRRIVEAPHEQAIDQSFLNQDCIFNLFETEEDEPPTNSKSKIEKMLASNNPKEVVPIFGTLHPLEGGKSFLYDEEALVLTAALRGLNNFLESHGDKLAKSSTHQVTGSYRMTLNGEKITIKVKSDTKITELLASYQVNEEEEKKSGRTFHSDFMPDGSFGLFKITPWDEVDALKAAVKHQKLSEIPLPRVGEGIPTLLIQTSKVKALEVIKNIESLNGLKGLCLGHIVSSEDYTYRIGILVAGNNDLLVASNELPEHFPQTRKAIQEWEKQAESLNKHCCVIVAMGVNGPTRRYPKVSQVFGYYEINFYAPEDVKLGAIYSIEMD